MTDLVVRAGTVITVDADRSVITDGAVAVAGDRIVEVGAGAEVVVRHPDARVISEPHGIVLPGLIDTHGHAGHSLLRTIGGDDLGAWMAACERVYPHGSTPAFWEADAALSGLERLMFGTTTGLSMLGGAGDTIRCDDPSYALGHVAGVRRIGIRDVVVVGPGAPPFPKQTTDGAGNSVESSFDDQMSTLQQVVGEAHDGSFTLVATTFPTLGLGDVEAGGDELMECAARLSQYAAEADLLIVQDGHRADSVLATDRLGLLNDRSLLSHSVDLGASAINALAERGSSVAHNPSAIYSQFGRCPVPELLEAGVTVALGSDATAPDRSSDMFRHMFQATRYHRALNRDPSMLPPGRVLEMATIDGAAALGMQDQLGSIEVGKLADLVVIDGDQPHLTPLIHPVHQVVYYATGADVSAVIVGGDVLMEQRRVLSVDVTEVLEAARAEHRSMLAANDLEHLTADRVGTWGLTRYPDGPGLEI